MGSGADQRLDAVGVAFAFSRGLSPRPIALSSNKVVGTVAHVEATIDRIENRKIFASGRLHDAGGRVYAETEGLFLKIKPERMTAIAGRFARSDSPTSSS